MEPGWNNQHSKPFPINTGVRQGCILSPHLFNIYTEQIMRDTITEDTGISVGGRKISNIRYADDTALCASLHQEAQRLLEELNGTRKARQLKPNAKKTKCMHIGNTTPNPIMVENEEIEEVNDFKYLGSVKTKNADCSKDINIRIGMSKRRMWGYEDEGIFML